MARRELLKNEDGYLTIVAALVILALLTVIGISASRVASTEATLARNEAVYKRNFYQAEGAALEAADRLAKNGNLKDSSEAWMEMVTGNLDTSSVRYYWDNATAAGDTVGLVDFARALRSMDIQLISTGGTYTTLHNHGIDVTPGSGITGFPGMLDGRVKTLHPKIHGGILARRDLPAHMDAIAGAGIPPIDLVVVNLSPFAQTVARPGCTLEEAIENIDIGGPAMVRRRPRTGSTWPWSPIGPTIGSSCAR